MSLVSNFIGGIGVSSLSNLSNPLKIDGDSTGFEELLQKQLEASKQSEPVNPLGGLGMPSGFEIEALGEIDASNTTETIKTETDMTQSFDLNNEEVTTSEAVTFFKSLLESNNAETEHAGVFDFVKKQASDLYYKHSKSVVMDIQDLAEGLHNIIN